ncbi:MAG: CDP-alcohol phosphatidyltransferase family protein [Bacteroidaceae bacterium]|nr:CDP-alcohol phosphatidyltransferase family protein [Bacteroidaceae bacterium]
MKEQDIKQTYKSNDTEEWLDRVFTRPIGYLWARLFARLGIHPNTVTILSILIGVSSAWFFAHGSYRTEGSTGLLLNIIGVLLMMWANFYDSADGQLARMTNQKTQLGRILDGAASIIIFVPVYCAMVWRCYLHHDMEFRWLGIADTEANALIYALLLFCMVLFSGFVCHSGQCRLADYYRQLHLFFLKGEAGTELSTSAQQEALYDAMPWRGHLIEKFFLKTYVNYTRSQEKSTPAAQRMLLTLRCKYDKAGNAPQVFREEFRHQSLPLMPLTNILTFNTRAIALYACCLADLPWLYFVFEIVVMSALCEYMRRRHETLCQSIIIQ